jgi:hypothetical protein
MSGIKPRHMEEFKRLTKQLDTLMLKIIKDTPEACLHLDGPGTVYLMQGPTYDESHWRNFLSENVVAHTKITAFHDW